MQIHGKTSPTFSNIKNSKTHFLNTQQHYYL